MTGVVNSQSESFAKSIENPSGFPSHWSWSSFDDCASEITVGFVGPMAQHYRATGVPFLRSKNVKAGYIDNRELCFITDEFHRRIPKSRLSTGDLVTVRTGEPGISAVIPEGYGELNCSDLVITRLLPCLDCRFAAHYLNTPTTRMAVTHGQVGVAQQHFNVGAMRRLRLPLPPLPEQRRIANILDRAEALRVKRRAALAQLNALTKSIFAEMFGDESSSKKRWPQVVVSDYVSSFQGGKSFDVTGESPADSSYRILRVSSVTSMVFRPDQSKAAPSSYEPPADHVVRMGDLLFSRANTTDLVGAVAYVDKEPGKLLLSDKIWRFVWKTPTLVDPIFVSKLFQSTPIRQEIGRRATGTSGSMKNISQEKLLQVPTILPPLVLQQEFARRVQAIDRLKAHHRQSLAEMDALFQSLQHRAFRGEL